MEGEWKQQLAGLDFTLQVVLAFPKSLKSGFMPGGVYVVLYTQKLYPQQWKKFQHASGRCIKGSRKSK